MRIGIGTGLDFPRSGGSGGGAPPATTPLTILESIRAGSAIQWTRPDADKVTLNGGNVASELDQSSGANHYTQGTAASQPLWIAGVAAANNRPGIQYDNINDYLDCAIARPAPATTSTLIYTVWRQDVWTLSDVLFVGISAVANSLGVTQQQVSPNLRMASASVANENSGGTLFAVKRAAFYFSGSVNDFSHVGSVLVTGASAGNTGGSTGFRKGANRTATVFSGGTEFDFIMGSGLTPAEAATAVTALDTEYAVPWFGAGIIT
jgi:hypothetical protein